MKAKDKLRAYWSKREGLMLAFPIGTQTKCDAGFLCGVLTKEVTDELDRRGYDLNTIKFSIEPKAGNQRFASQGEGSQPEISK
jgi:hypothetical protein